MTNERYLIVSYFVVAAVSMVIGLGAYGWLRSPVKTLAAALPWRTFGELLRRIFPVGIVFPALLGFVSVKYFGCNVETYQKVIAHRDYLVTKNQEQISASFTYVMGAVVFWCAIVALLLALTRRSERSSRE